MTARDAARSWLAADPDPDTRSELEELLGAADSGDPRALEAIEDAFSGPLVFGTAGLRGRMGAGPNRMNRLVVARAAIGVADWLEEHGHTGGQVLVGHDARHKSEEFARDTAEILAGAGFKVLLTGTPIPTPLVSFGIRRYGCVAGIVVTASHNPAADNGYKVYLGDGSQIIPPTDTQIAAHIAAHPVDSLARLPRSDSYEVMCDQITRDYVTRGAGLVPEGAAREITWVHTAMHGVGARTLRELTRAAGFPPAHEVPEQAEPDPDFPTVAFPNPEEPGAIDMALALAGRTGADLVVANDPDVDRCAVAAVVDDRWRMLTGDELGLLLADHMIRRGAKGVLASSVVSSGALAALAAARGRDHVTTLTGFKWIGRVPDLAFGYEEAIGYCCDPGAVPDKDGLTAALMVLELAAGLRAEGLTLADRLDELTAELGLHATSQVAIRVSDLSLIADAMARLRQNPPTSLLHAPVTYRDLAEGTSGLPPTDAVELSGDEVHVVVRPSGTEPKLKCYLEVRLTPERSRTGAAARLAAEIRMTALQGQMQSVLGLG